MTPEQIAEKLTDAQKDALWGRYSYASPSSSSSGEIELAEYGVWNMLFGLPAEERLTKIGHRVRYLLTTTHTNRSMGE